MKKFFLKSVVLGMMMVFGTNVTAQINLNDIIGAVTGNGESSSSTGDLISNLTSVFSSEKQASASNVIGTWVYQEPAVLFQSDNILTKAGAKIASNKIESKLQTYLTKYGITPGTMKMTFNQDGTFVETLKGKTIMGKWTVKDSKLYLTFANVKTVPVTTQISGKEMMFVTDATKLFYLVKGVASQSSNSNIKTITSLMNNVKGMQAGLTLKKQ
jgi:hypothetical protein